MKMNILADFEICISVTLKGQFLIIHWALLKQPTGLHGKRKSSASGFLIANNTLRDSTVLEC